MKTGGINKCFDGRGAASRFTFARQQRGQLCDVRRNSLGSAARLPLEIDIGERLPVGVADIKAGFGFLNGPGRRETAMTP